MRKLVATLALTSVAFAASTIYFARALAIERDRSAVASAAALPAKTVSAQPTAASLPAAMPASVSAQPATEKPSGDRNVAASFLSEPGVPQSLTEADIRKAQAEYSKTMLAQLADPDRREEMLAEHKMMMRYSYPRVDQVLGLSAEEHSRFLELFAQQQMDMQEASAHCMNDPACDLRDLHVRQGDSRKREIDELLGAERSAKFEAYKNTIGEREVVNQLRNRLPDVQRLSDANTELLVAALAEERDLIQREARTTGTRGLGMGVGMVFAPTEDGTFEERYEIAQQSSQRLRDRASQYLTAEQMRVFNEMQDETLISLRGALRNKGVSFSAVSVARPEN